MCVMVTLQAPDLKENESNECNRHKNNCREANENNNSLTLDSSSLPIQHDSISDSTVPCCSGVNDGDTDNSEIIEIDDDDEYNDEIEYDEKQIISNQMGWMKKVQHETHNGQVLPSLDSTTFGEVCVTNSTNVRVGNTTLYKGPVTIKQVVYTNSKSINENDEAINNSSPSNNDFHHISVKDDSNKLSVHEEHNDVVRQWLWTWRCAVILCVMGLILVTVIVVSMVMLTHQQEFSANFLPSIDPDDILTENIRFIQRVEWGAQPPESPINNLTITPVPYVIISHTASEPCYNQADCIQRVRLAQTMHIEGNKWSDIAYNFLVGGDGLVYVGRGWDSVGAHAFGFNNKSMGISLIGTFNKLVPPSRQLHALSKLIAIGVKKGKIRNDYKLLGHRQVSETLSPGNVIYSIIQQWDHWSEKP